MGVFPSPPPLLAFILGFIRGRGQSWGCRASRLGQLPGGSPWFRGTRPSGAPQTVTSSRVSVGFPPGGRARSLPGWVSVRRRPRLAEPPSCRCERLLPLSVRHSHTVGLEHGAVLILSLPLHVVTSQSPSRKRQCPRTVSGCPAASSIAKAG